MLSSTGRGEIVRRLIPDASTTRRPSAVSATPPRRRRRPNYFPIPRVASYLREHVIHAWQRTTRGKFLDKLSSASSRVLAGTVSFSRLIAGFVSERRDPRGRRRFRLRETPIDGRRSSRSCRGARPVTSPRPPTVPPPPHVRAPPTRRTGLSPREAPPECNSARRFPERCDPSPNASLIARVRPAIPSPRSRFGDAWNGSIGSRPGRRLGRDL